MTGEVSSTPLGRVRGLGSAQHGGGHWLRERLTSAALLLLGIWLVASLLMLPGLDHKTVADWLRSASAHSHQVRTARPMTASPLPVTR